MIKFSNIFLTISVSAILPAIGTIENLILNRRKTFTVMFLDEVFFTLVSFILFGWISLIFGAIGLGIIIYIKLQDKYDEEYSYLNYSEGIFSVSKIINELGIPKAKEKGIVVGTVMPVSFLDIKNNGKGIFLSEDALSRGSMLTGATGSGKTRSLINIITQAIKKKKPIFFFDFKGEVDILEELSELADSAKIQYYEFSSRRISFKYDPFINLNNTGKIQALMNSKAWAADGSDSYYKTSLQALLQDLIPTYDEYRRKNNITSNFIVGLNDFIYSDYKVAPNHKDGFTTLKSILDLMVKSRVRDMLENDNEEFSFDNDEPCIIAFSFVSANKDLANYICSFIFQDIMDRGTRRRYVNKPLLVIDEFGTLANSALIKDILEKGRSVGIQTIISLQDINQIVENVSRDFAISILGTISTFIIHPGATQTSAELMGSVYRYESAEFDIMNLEMPQGGKPPTCAFISKIRVLNDKGAQELHKMIPYTEGQIKIKDTGNVPKKVYKLDEKDIRLVEKEQLEENETPQENEINDIQNENNIEIVTENEDYIDASDLSRYD